MKMLWKEWRQQRCFFRLGLLTGLVFSAFDLLYTWQRVHVWQAGAGAVSVILFGPLFALILAIATTHEDVKGGTLEFWQSRPVSAGRMLGLKFLVGAAGLLALFVLVETLDYTAYFYQQGAWSEFAWRALCWAWPVGVMLFSITVFFTVLTRDSAKAVLLAIWLGLLVYFLPLLIGGLNWLNLFVQVRWYNRESLVGNVLVPFLLGQRSFLPSVYEPSLTAQMTRVSFGPAVASFLASPEFRSYLGFVAFTAAVAIACISLSVLTVRRRWHWQPGQKTIVWALGLSAVFLFALSMFQVGNNFTRVTSDRGKPIQPVMALDDKAENVQDWLDPKTAGPALNTSAESWFPSELHADGTLLYRVSYFSDKAFDPKNVQPIRRDWILDIYRHPVSDGQGCHLSRTRFASQAPSAVHQYGEAVDIFVKDHRLYVGYAVSEHLKARRENISVHVRYLVADVQDPGRPKLIANREIYGRQGQIIKRTGGRYSGNFRYLAFTDELVMLNLGPDGDIRVAQKVLASALGIEKNPTIPWMKRNPIPGQEFFLTNDRIIFSNSFMVLVLDVSRPEKPRAVFQKDLSQADFWSPEGGIGKVLAEGNTLFALTAKGIHVYQLAPSANGSLSAEVVGGRRATPLELMAGGYPREAIIEGNRLYELASGFGLLVFDVSQPSTPRRIGHAGDTGIDGTMGFWDGLFYIAGPNHGGGVLTFLAARH